MIALLAILAPISLLDSTSMVPISIVPITTILAGRRALRGAIAFIAGIFVTYAAVGALAVMGLDAVFTRLNAEFTRFWKHPDTLDFALQIVIGAVLLIIGQRMANARRNKEREAPPDVTPWQAFTFASGLVIVGLPGAIPHFAAVDQMLQADLPVAQTVLTWGRRVIVVALIVLGLILVVDGVGWFFGKPLIPVGWPGN
jgi:uncharacterized membrane protein YphA (DoxX/SURF4 family)